MKINFDSHLTFDFQTTDIRHEMFVKRNKIFNSNYSRREREKEKKDYVRFKQQMKLIMIKLVKPAGDHGTMQQNAFHCRCSNLLLAIYGFSH